MAHDNSVRPSIYFNFLMGLGLEYDEQLVARMNWRHTHIIDPLIDEIKGARVLDLGSHDGRWPSAYADAGAREVIGIEGRAGLVEQFDRFPTPNKSKVKLRVGDFVDEMDKLIAAGETFDLVSCLGVYYHTMQHYRMMLQMAAFKPKVIVIDSEFATSDQPVMLLSQEKTANKMNSIEQTDGQSMVTVGIPSRRAVRLMAKSVGYDTKFVTWDVPESERKSVRDYWDKPPHRIRLTAVLRPMPVEASGADL